MAQPATRHCGNSLTNHAHTRFPTCTTSNFMYLMTNHAATLPFSSSAPSLWCSFASPPSQLRVPAGPTHDNLYAVIGKAPGPMLALYRNAVAGITFGQWNTGTPGGRLDMRATKVTCEPAVLITITGATFQSVAPHTHLQGDATIKDGPTRVRARLASETGINTRREIQSVDMVSMMGLRMVLPAPATLFLMLAVAAGSCALALGEGPSTTGRVAVIGDFGNDGAGEARVASLVKGWDTAVALSAVVTTGDNNYDFGAASTIANNIGKHYGWAILPDAASNRFWPVPGNHVSPLPWPLHAAAGAGCWLLAQRAGAGCWLRALVVARGPSLRVCRRSGCCFTWNLLGAVMGITVHVPTAQRSGPADVPSAPTTAGAPTPAKRLRRTGATPVAPTPTA